DTGRPSSRWYDTFRMPLVPRDCMSMADGHLPLLDQASFRIDARERVSIIGRNGTGKSTLLQIVGGDVAPQSGEVWHAPGLRIRRLPQDALFAEDREVFAVVPEGLASTVTDSWQVDQQVRMTLSRLQIPADATMDRISGGWERPVVLPSWTVGEPG